MTYFDYLPLKNHYMKKKRDDNPKNGSILSFFKNLLRGQGPLRQIGFKALYFLPPRPPNKTLQSPLSQFPSFPLFSFFLVLIL